MLASILKIIGVKLSINDPRWGRGSQNDDQNRNQGDKKSDGPPDLDDLWRDFNQHLNRLFGGKGGMGDGPGLTPGGARGLGLGVAVFLIVILSLWLVSGFFIVQEGQTAIVLTFGKFTRKADPGFNWRWPYPIQAHEIVNDQQVRTVEVGYRGNVGNKQPKESLMLTDDENIVDIQFAVQYMLKDPVKWAFTNRDQEDSVMEVAESSMREMVGKHKLDYVLYEDSKQLALEARQLMQQVLDRYDSGVQVTDVKIQGAQPPEQVQAAFDDTLKAQQDRERQKNEGQAYANNVVPKARGDASRLIQEAEAYRARVVDNAQGDAARFNQVVSEYKKAPVVTRDRMYLDTMQQIFASNAKVLVDTKSGSNMLYLPLDKLMGPSAGNSDAGRQPPAAPTAPSAAPSLPSDTATPTDSHPSDPRSRETRDREAR